MEASLKSSSNDKEESNQILNSESFSLNNSKLKQRHFKENESGIITYLQSSNRMMSCFTIIIFLLFFTLIFFLNIFYYFKLSSLIIGTITIMAFSSLLLLEIYYLGFKTWRFKSLVTCISTQVLIYANIFCNIIRNSSMKTDNNLLKISDSQYCIAYFYTNFILANSFASYFAMNCLYSQVAIYSLNCILLIILASMGYFTFFEIISVLILTFSILTLSMKIKYSLSVLISEILITRENLTNHKRLIEGVKIGYCLINKQMLLLSQNEYFSNNLQHLIREERDRTCRIYRESSNILSNSVDCQLDVENRRVLYKRSMYLDVGQMVQKKNGGELVNLSEVIITFIEDSLNSDKNNFFNLKKFKYKNKDNLPYERTLKRRGNYKDRDLVFDVYIRKYSQEENYELIFINLSSESAIDKIKAEKKYKNLLLAKISHEFKAPIMYIQNTIDNVLEAERILDKTPVSPYMVRPFFKTESILQLKYLSEVLLLLVMDLSEYLNENGTITRQNTIKNNQSIMELSSLKNYLKNISHSLMLINGKRLKVVVLYEEGLELAKVTIDEKKLKQILANLLSNAIKNTIEGSITITIKSNGDTRTVENAYDQNNRSYSIHINNPLKDEIQSDVNAGLIGTLRNSRRIGVPDMLIHRNSVFSNANRINLETVRDNLLCEGFIITIEDTGPGLDDEVINMVNDERTENPADFFIFKGLSEDSTMQNYEHSKGIGIGLPICKKLCRELSIHLKCSVIRESNATVIESNQILSKIESNRIKGSRFTLKFNQEVDISSCLLTNTRVTYSKDMVLSPGDKNLVQYESSDCGEETPKKVHFKNIDNVISIQINGSNSCSPDISENPLVGKRSSMASESIFESTNGFTRATSKKGTVKTITDSNYTNSLVQGNSNNLINTLRRFSNAGLGVGSFRRNSLYNSNNILKQLNANFGRRESNSRFNRRKSFYYLANNNTNISNNTSRKRGSDMSNDGMENILNFLKSYNEQYQGNMILPEDLGIGIDDNMMHSVITEQDLEEGDDVRRNTVNANNLNKVNDRHKESNKFLDVSRKTSSRHSVSQTNSPKKSVRKFSVDQLKRSSLSSSASLDSKNKSLGTIPKVLIIDDNKNNQDAIERLVKRYITNKSKGKNGFNSHNPAPIVVKLNDGIELIYEIYKEILSQGKNLTKIIFCDEMMNFMNGSEAFTILNKILVDKGIKKIPFIICSAFNQEGHFEKMKSLSIEHVYEKPLSYGNVEYIMDTLLPSSSKKE